MDWTPGGLSDDVEDRRGSSGGGGGFGGGGLGIVGFIILVVISLVTGRNYIGSYLGRWWRSLFACCEPRRRHDLARGRSLGAACIVRAQ